MYDVRKQLITFDLSICSNDNAFKQAMANRKKQIGVHSDKGLLALNIFNQINGELQLFIYL